MDDRIHDSRWMWRLASPFWLYMGFMSLIFGGAAATLFGILFIGLAVVAWRIRA